MSVFYLQKGYAGREVNAVKFSAVSQTLIESHSYCLGENTILVGTVEWIESLVGSVVPDYYPEWTRDIWHRKITEDQRGLENTRLQFVKPSDRYKRFVPHVVCFQNPKTYTEINDFYFANGPFIFSEVVEFVNEWRYYIANGEVLASWWYDGEEEVSENDPHGPVFPLEIPKGYCGAVDLGILNNGKLALVEAHHPYSIGWYGDNDSEDRKIYIKFLEEGWKYLWNTEFQD